MLVSYLRWVIPLAIGLIGVGYILLEQVGFQGQPLFSPDVVRTAAVFGLTGPALAWVMLSWARRIAVAEAKAQQELAFRNRELAALNAIGDVTSQSLNLDEILRAALEKMVELMGLQAGEMRVVEGDRLILKAHYGVSQAKIKEPDVRLGQCLCGTCAQAGETLTMDNLPGEPSLANVPCAKEGFRSIINIPMKTKGQVLGVILLASRNQNAIASVDRQILNAIGYRVAMAIENVQLYQKARRRAVHLETASLVGQRMAALLELDSLLAEAVNLIRDKFGYYHVHMFLEDEETREIVLKEASGASAELIKARGLRLKVGQEGITGWVAHTGQTLVCNDVSREPRYYKTELVPDTKAELAVPLRAGNQIIGVLDVQSDRINAFDKEDVTVLQILGNQIGIAIQNAKLFQQTRRRYDAMIALHETSLDVIAQLNTTEVLDALLRRGAQLLDAQAGSLFLYDAKESLIYDAANYNTWRDWSGVKLHLGEGLIGRVIQTGKPVIENDYENWPGKSGAFDGTPQTRVVGVPLKWQDEIIGGIDLLNDQHARPFDRNDVWLLSHFADLAIIAIKNAELHTQVKEFSQELERKISDRTDELSRARDEIVTKAEQLSSLLARTIDMQEAERARIARDMHDGVIQLISAARFELQATQIIAGPALPATAEEKLKTTFQILQEMEKEIRRVIYDLHPPILDAVGLAPAIQKHTKIFGALAGIDCGVQVNGIPYRLPQAVEIAVFRMVEEALQNIVAHAHANRASIVLDYAPNLFCVCVHDNGLGFDYNGWMEEHDGNHLGLLGMQERIQSLGGKMEVSSESGHGTRVMFQLPVVQGEDMP